ncbi:YbgS-like family protein [Phytobacter sp. V91]|uniref:YbgS-like family protein n=1 Tax=Phytobacter sp. V91 TaxID=3369425 RepID=UPI003F5F07A6
MKMNKLAVLWLTTTLTLASGAALAADSTSQTNNGQANAAASAGQVAPDAKANLAPNDGGTQSGTMLHPQNSPGHGMSDDSLTKDQIHKNSQCKDGKCPDINDKIQTGNGISNDVNSNTDGTTQ